MTTTESRAAVFTSTRPLLLSIAYRMLGSVMDAEDLVQDVYLRWQEAPDDVQSPRAFLATVTTRLAINHLRSARSRRETYVGPWLPEPLVTEHASDPSESVELAESLSMAFLVMLERLSPVERAVLLLHDVFDFDYAEIARIVDKSEANCRQLLSRAKKHLGKAEARFDADPAEAERLMQRFIDSARGGDVDGMVALFAEDVTLWPDAGGKVRGAALRPVHGPRSVARLIAGVLERVIPAERIIRTTELNGEPGFIAYVGGQPFAALLLNIRDGRIRNIYAMANPDKLMSIRRDAPMQDTSVQQSTHVFRIDRFTVALTARDEFLGRVLATHTVLRRQPGFVRDYLLEQPADAGRVAIVTFVEWDRAERMAPAKAAVQTMYRETSFDPEEFFRRLDVEKEFGTYRPIGEARP